MDFGDGAIAARAGAEPGPSAGADTGVGAMAAAAAAAAVGLDTGTAYLRCASLVGLDAAAPMKRRVAWAPGRAPNRAGARQRNLVTNAM